MDIKCINHRTKNRMKPKRAIPCMARTNTAMSLLAGAGSRPAADRWWWWWGGGATEVVRWRMKRRPPSDTSTERQKPAQLVWTGISAKAWRCWSRYKFHGFADSLNDWLSADQRGVEVSFRFVTSASAFKVKVKGEWFCHLSVCFST